MEYVAIIVLLALSAFFSASETAISSVNKIRFKHEAAEGNKKAERTLKLAEEYDKTITTILVGNNIVNILSASLATIICTTLFAEKYGTGTATAISTVAMTLLVLIFGEILPKSLAKQHADTIAPAISGILRFFKVVLTPVTVIFGALQKGASKLFGSGKGAPSVTEDELKYIIDEIEEEGVLEEQESDLVRSALEFDDKNISEVLIPRVRITAVERHDSIDHIRDVFFKEQYSRMPVYEKNIDNIIGFIHERDFFKMIVSDEKPADIESIIHELIYITEFATVSEVLARMQKEKVHMAIIKDQYGGTYGMVTMEDLIEELLGDIYDEADEEEHSCVKLADNVYECAAELNISDFEEYAELPENSIDTESYTMGGWAMELFGRIPDKGDVTESGRFVIEVLDAEDNRIIRMKVTVKDEESKSEE